MPLEATITKILHPTPAKKDFTKCPEGELIDAAIRLAWADLPKKCFECPPNRYLTEIIKEGGVRTHVVLNNFKRGEICRFKITPDKLELVENSDDTTQGGVAALPEIHRQAKQESAKFRGARI